MKGWKGEIMKGRIEEKIKRLKDESMNKRKVKSDVSNIDVLVHKIGLL